jgi:hypothetical protein
MDNHWAFLADTMSVGPRMELWCRSRKQINTTSVSGGRPNSLKLDCGAELLIFEILTANNNILYKNPYVIKIPKSQTQPMLLLCA